MRDLIDSIIFFFTSLDKNLKALILVASDSFILFFSWCLFFPLPAIILTGYDENIFYYFLQDYTVSFSVSIFIYLLIMHICRGFNEIIRSFTIENLLPITFATTGYIFSLTLVNGLMVPEANQSYIIFIQSLSAGTISFAFIVFSRVLFRLLSSRHSEKSAQKVIIFGVEDSAKELYTSLTYNKQKTIVGFISNDLNSIGRELFGKRIFSIKEARDIWKSNNKIQLYLASRSITEEEKGELINLCVSLGVKVKQISSYSDMLREKEINLTDLNISDLLPRSNIDQFTSDIKFLNNKNIVISGAGGSIGSEISRIIAKIAKPKKLILLDISEASLFAIAEDLLWQEYLTAQDFYKLGYSIFHLPKPKLLKLASI